MVQYLLESARVADFVAHLQTRKTVYAPQRKGRTSCAFAAVEDPAAVVLDYDRTLHSVKKYFLPPTEQLLSFDLRTNEFAESEVAPCDAVFLGVHSYDLRAVHKLDHNFSQGNPEKNYLKRREGAVFVGVSFEPDAFHFSGSVGIGSRDSTGFDVFLTKVDGGYALTVHTPEGEDLIKGFELRNFTGDLPVPPAFQQHIYVPQEKLSKVFEKSYRNEVWEETAAKCVSCGTCNLVCPTCYCFDVDDHVDVTATGGTRARTWDGCMLRNFSEVAGGEVFREEAAARQRHRVYRKFKYISDTTGEPWCVGCGRCTQACTAGISIVNIVNRLVNDYDREVVEA
jgi:formate hydrogenlyase subunit 6/NADH:ubiquinone oxidoreductase subunit I